MNTETEATDSNRIELSPTQYKAHEHYVVSQEKSGTYTVYVMNADDWDKLPISGDGPSYVFDGDLEEYGAEPIDQDPYAIETYDLAPETTEQKKNRVLATVYEDMCDPWLTDCDVQERSSDSVTVYIDWESMYSYDIEESEYDNELLTVNVLDTEPAGEDYYVTVPAVIYDFYEHYLSESESVAHALIHAHGLSYNDVAEAMEISVETVKTYVSRISKKKNKARRTLELLD